MRYGFSAAAVVSETLLSEEEAHIDFSFL